MQQAFTSRTRRGTECFEYMENGSMTWDLKPKDLPDRRSTFTDPRDWKCWNRWYTCLKSDSKTLWEL